MMFTYTFIIPHHNCPKLLNRCLDSIPQRDDIQIIVVDDASDADKLPQIERPDIELFYVEKTETKGAGHARNVGLAHAEGNWLLFADCDDYYSANFISILDTYKDSDNDIVIFRSYYRLEEDERTINTACWEEKAFDLYNKSEKRLQEKKWLGLSMPCPWNKMYRRSYIESIGGKFEEIPMCNDMWFVSYTTSKIQKAAVLNDRLYNYIQYSSGITKSKRPLDDYLKVIKSDRRINRIKKKNGVVDLILLPGFNKAVVIRDFGKATYYKLLAKRLLTEIDFDHAVLRRVLVKLRILNTYTIKICPK